ncbi:Glucosylceramidase [Meloidogyne graminicola]|uniref:Glucosylceramidase n=2 Tax=Meloidogyne graminicola TaxID=189291 RepID=A0A8S9ZG03_9BILA|nr:Glucosylceramidase [Meloidogyne graminicola]
MLSFILFSLLFKYCSSMATINPEIKNQIIEGFGTSTAWKGPCSSRIFKQLYGDLGYSILRIRISEHKDSPWDGWHAEVPNVKQAKSYGAQVFATPWTAPANLKVCGQDKSCPLRQDKYNDYADYLQSYVNYMKQNGAPIDILSLINEPDFKTDAYNTMNFTPDEMVKFLKTSAKRISGTKIMASESYGYSPATNDAILNDPQAAAKVDIVARHGYGFHFEPQTKVHQMGKGFWLTEFTADGQDWKSVMNLAKAINDCMTKALCNAFVYWWLHENTQNMMILDSAEQLTPKAYVMGQFSKFIKRGYVRIDTNSDDNNILISGYIGGQNKLVIVAINIGSNSINQQFSINGGSALYTSLTPYITSQGKNLEKQLNIKLNGGKFTYSIPGQSKIKIKMNIILIFYLIFIIFSIHINGETKINLNKKYQTIDGFGASSAWQGEVSDKIMDNLFNKVGLSILRIRISEHKEISWDGWQVELSNAKKALKYNALVFASPWKPGNNLADMSLSKSGTIPSNKYNDYADYLQSFVNYMKQNGAPLYAISLQNEPDCASTDWTSQQMVNF